LRRNDQANLGRGLVGESAINFATKPGSDREPAPEGFAFLGTVANIEQRLKQAGDLIPASQAAMDEFLKAARNFNDLVPDLRKTNDEARVTLHNVAKAAETTDNLLRANEEKLGKAIDNFNKSTGRLVDLLTDENIKSFNQIVKNFQVASNRLPGFFSEQN